MPRVLRSREVTSTQRWVPEAAIVNDPVSLAEAQAAQILAAAQTHAAQIVADAQAASLRLHEEASAAGYQAGDHAGRQQYDDACTNIQRLSDELAAEQEDFFDRMEPELIRLTVAIAEKVVDRQLTLQPEIVVELARTYLKRIREREVLNIRVHPDSLPMMTAEKLALLQTVDGIRELHLHEDRRVGHGGIVLETPQGSLDGRISAKLGVVSKAFDDALGAAHDSESTHD